MYDHFIFQWIATDFNFTDWTDYVKTTGQVLISTVVDKVVFRTHLLIYYCPRLQSWVAMTESMAHKGWNICNFVLYRKFTGSFPCCSVSSYMYCMLFVWFFLSFFLLHWAPYLFFGECHLTQGHLHGVFWYLILQTTFMFLFHSCLCSFEYVLYWQILRPWIQIVLDEIF